MPLPPASLLLSLALLTRPPAAGPLGGATVAPDGRAIELLAEGSGKPREVRLSAGQATTWVFDTPIVPGGVRVEGCERCQLLTGKAGLTLIPPGTAREGARWTLTVPFADGEAPASAEFWLVIHPDAERQVAVFRQRRTVAACHAELEATRAAVRQCQEELAGLRAVHEAEPGGLTGLLASGFMGDNGIPIRRLSKEATPRPGGALRLERATSFRAKGSVAVELWLANVEGSEPWMAAGAKLVNRSGAELRPPRAWQARPISKGQMERVVVEVGATTAQAQGPYTLTLWAEDGKRTVTLDNVTFP